MRKASLAGAALVVALSVGACGDLQTVADTQTAAGSIATAVTVAQDPNATVLTKAQADSCAAQAALNAATDMLNSTGHTGAAASSGVLSAIAGVGCTWGKSA